MENETTPVFKKPSTDMSRFKVVKNNRGSQRGEMLDKFLERLNADRKGTKYPPLTINRLATMLSHIPTDQLYPFYQDCARAKSFGAYFFWSLKPENAREPAKPV